jgi:hypothetical protein
MTKTELYKGHQSDHKYQNMCDVIIDHIKHILVDKSYLKRLNKCPEKNSDGVTLSQELDQTSSSKESQKSDIDEIFLKILKLIFLPNFKKVSIRFLFP